MAKTPRKKIKRTKPRPVWERGYLSHGLWLGKNRVGMVRMDKDARPEEKYRWEAGTLAGGAASLEEAKRAVEQAVLMGAMQLPLFDPPQRD
jgi:hypothetical protein